MLQVVNFRRSIWGSTWFTGPPWWRGFWALRLGRVELRFGITRKFWEGGRPPNQWAYENG